MNPCQRLDGVTRPAVFATFDRSTGSAASAAASSRETSGSETSARGSESASSAIASRTACLTVPLRRAFEPSAAIRLASDFGSTISPLVSSDSRGIPHSF